MEVRKKFFHWMTWLLVFLLAAPPWVIAQGTQGTGESKTFNQEELDQMLAPIALYPDDLLSQILIASTYPLEIVQADRWTRQNKNLKGDALTQALEKQNWDPSVKSLVNFPEVLGMMSEKLDWTEKLGDAFLASEKNVMDTVQKLRFKAQEAGNLKSTEQQKVVVQEKVIIIQPAQPQVIYVPTYSPAVVYGTWWWPAYPPPPPFFPPPPGAALYGAMAFGAGVAMGAAWGYAWGHANWHGGNVNYNVNQNININNNINRNVYAKKYQGGSGTWQHDATHRGGVSYRDPATARKYNKGSSAEAAKSREAFRGRPEQGRQDLARGTGGDRTSKPGTAQTRDLQASKAGQRDTQQGRGTASGAGQQASQQRGGGTGGQAFQQKTGGTGKQPKENAFSGIGSGNQTQSYSNRGSASRSGGSSGGKAPSGGSASSGPRSGADRK